MRVFSRGRTRNGRLLQSCSYYNKASFTGLYHLSAIVCFYSEDSQSQNLRVAKKSIPQEGLEDLHIG